MGTESLLLLILKQTYKTYLESSKIIMTISIHMNGEQPHSRALDFDGNRGDFCDSGIDYSITRIVGKVTRKRPIAIVGHQSNNHRDDK